jgi:phosphoglycolate phosphatase-like HAD superfamily hydrolase
MPGLDAFLAATAPMPRAIVTLMGEQAMDAVCERFRIDIATRVGRRVELAPKPAPDQPTAACAELGVDPAAAAMLGDSLWDQVAAEAAGVGFIGLTNGRPSEFRVGTTLATDLGAAVSLLAVAG